jgi:hypothetical protein
MPGHKTVEIIFTVHFTEQWRAAQTKVKRKGKGSLEEGEEQRSEGVEEGRHSSLFRYNVNSGDKEAA